MRWRDGIFAAWAAGVVAQKNPIDYVDPLIGTTNGGRVISCALRWDDADGFQAMCFPARLCLSVWFLACDGISKLTGDRHGEGMSRRRRKR